MSEKDKFNPAAPRDMRRHVIRLGLGTKEQQAEAQRSLEEERRDLSTRIAQQLKSLRERLGRSKFITKDDDVFRLAGELPEAIEILSYLNSIDRGEEYNEKSLAENLRETLNTSRIKLLDDREVYIFSPDVALVWNLSNNTGPVDYQPDEYEILLATDQDDEIEKMLIEEKRKLQESLDKISGILA